VPPQVLLVDEKLARGAGEAVADGFHDNEIWSWMLPSEWRRRRVLRRHYPAMVRHVFVPRGTAWTTPDLAGAALWMGPGALALSRRERIVETLSLLPEGVTGLGRGARFEELISRHHPQSPHWYLNTLSVRPDAQRGGYGSALIAPGLGHADADGLPAYLETQRESNIPFYRRFGFELTDHIEGPGLPGLWLMWREPASGRRPASPAGRA
jgi:GNAT superfamily N-acetyltransferase